MSDCKRKKRRNKPTWKIYHQGLRIENWHSEWKARREARIAARELGGDWVVYDPKGKAIFTAKGKKK